MKPFAFLLVFMGFLTGCSNAPSVGEAEAYTNTRVQSESDSHIKLVRFIKTNGQAVDASGVKGYRLDYEAEIEFDSDGTWLVGMPHVTYHFSTEHTANGSWAGFGNSVVGGRVVRKGQRAKISGTITAEKTENGWKLSNSDDRIAVEPTSNLADTHPLSASEIADAKPCIANLKLIDDAKQRWALERMKGPDDIPAWSDILPFIVTVSQAKPLTCPSGGNYVLNAVNQKPQCSVPGHVLP